ncbi:hypothetical protein PUN28_010887 [Cardiocondyla obscurior]|uniref:Uncharacterized protein n=1 Tax=Cardiocondyla obscurior TaxID=286306 RepID=A0AAW2FJR5_9HYME
MLCTKFLKKNNQLRNNFRTCLFRKEKNCQKRGEQKIHKYRVLRIDGKTSLIANCLRIIKVCQTFIFYTNALNLTKSENGKQFVLLHDDMCASLAALDTLLSFNLSSIPRHIFPLILLSPFRSLTRFGKMFGAKFVVAPEESCSRAKILRPLSLDDHR